MLSSESMHDALVEAADVQAADAAAVRPGGEVQSVERSHVALERHLREPGAGAGRGVAAVDHDRRRDRRERDRRGCTVVGPEKAISSVTAAPLALASSIASRSEQCAPSQVPSSTLSLLVTVNVAALGGAGEREEEGDGEDQRPAHDRTCLAACSPRRFSFS